MTSRTKVHAYIGDDDWNRPEWAHNRTGRLHVLQEVFRKAVREGRVLTPIEVSKAKTLIKRSRTIGLEEPACGELLQLARQTDGCGVQEFTGFLAYEALHSTERAEKEAVIRIPQDLFNDLSVAMAETEWQNMDEFAAHIFCEYLDPECKEPWDYDWTTGFAGFIRDMQEVLTMAKRDGR